MFIIFTSFIEALIFYLEMELDHLHNNEHDETKE